MKYTAQRKRGRMFKKAAIPIKMAFSPSYTVKLLLKSRQRENALDLQFQLHYFS